MRSRHPRMPATIARIAAAATTPPATRMTAPVVVRLMACQVAPMISPVRRRMFRAAPMTSRARLTTYRGAPTTFRVPRRMSLVAAGPITFPDRPKYRLDWPETDPS